jgi:hypothetical protein
METLRQLLKEHNLFNSTEVSAVDKLVEATEMLNETYGRDIMSDLIRLNHAMYKKHGKNTETSRLLKKLVRDFSANPNSEKVLNDLNALKAEYPEYFSDDDGPTSADRQPLKASERSAIETLLKINLAVKKDESIDIDTKRHISRRLNFISRKIDHNVPTQEIDDEIQMLVAEFNLSIDLD